MFQHRILQFEINCFSVTSPTSQTKMLEFLKTLFNTRITAFLTYLELPQAVKMTVCQIKNKMRNNLALLYLIRFFNLYYIPNDYLNFCRCEFGAF